VTGTWRDRTLLELLTEFGLELLPEHDFPTDGWSGATFTSIVDGYGRRFVLKRTSMAVDWIARATNDQDLREGWMASIGSREVGWARADIVPYLGAAADRDGVAILTPDLSNELIAWERPGHDPAIDTETLGRVLQAVARLHAVPWSRSVEAALERDSLPPPPWCPLAERLTLLAPQAAARYQAEGNPVGDRFMAGWDAFRQLAPPDAWALVERLGADPSPLVLALEVLPWVGLHGDLKLANVALLPDGKVSFIDWQMTMRGPVAVELGWFLVSNSGSLPLGPDDVLRTYRDALEWDSGRWGFGSEPHDFAGLAGDWDLQRDLTWIVGLLLRGWRKGLDARAGVMLPSGVSAADDLAWWCEQAVEASYRRL
jgi:Phosphotransferase enzyme family